jgi:hypothetical protein
MQASSLNRFGYLNLGKYGVKTVSKRIENLKRDFL